MSTKDARQQQAVIKLPVLTHSTTRYVQALYAAHDALAYENDFDVVTRATARLRKVVPDHPMLPALDAKIGRMQIIAGLLDGSLAESEDK